MVLRRPGGTPDLHVYILQRFKLFPCKELYPGVDNIIIACLFQFSSKVHPYNKLYSLNLKVKIYPNFISRPLNKAAGFVFS